MSDPAPVTDGVRVLYVDGDADDAAAFAARVPDVHDALSVTTASTAAAGLEAVSAGDVDCAVSAYSLPGTDGVSFLRRVRAERPDLPFVLFVARGSESVASDAVAAGVTEYVPRGGGADEDAAYRRVADRILAAVSARRSDAASAPDATDYRRELREERALVESVLDTLPDVFYSFDLDGRVVRWNDRLSEVTGYSDAEMAEATVFDLVAADDVDRIERAIRDVLETGYASVEASCRTESGERLPYELNGSRIADDEGNVLGVAGTGRDVTHRKRYEDTLTALHDATRRLAGAETRRGVAEVASRSARDVLDLPLNGVHFYDADADSLVPAAVSPRTRELLIEPPDLPRGESAVWRAFETGELRVYDDVRDAPDVLNPDTPVRGELHLPLGDHGVFIAGSTAVGDFDETDISLARTFGANVEAALDRADREETLREREASLSRQNERLDRFASILSHDIRNPLNVAQGRVELAADSGCTPDDDGAPDHLVAATRALDRIEELVADVLTLAREGRDVSETEPVALDAAAREAAEAAGLPASALTVAGAPGVVEADPERLRTVFENLFRNSVEHSSTSSRTPLDDGAGRDAVPVRVRVGRLDDGRGFFVEDDGPGIPTGERDRVFDHGHSTADAGTGFGLSIVAGVAEAHGWTVGATESSGGGARFEVRGVDFV